MEKQLVEFKKGGIVFGVELKREQIIYYREGEAVRYKDVKPEFNKKDLEVHAKAVAAAQGVTVTSKSW